MSRWAKIKKLLGLGKPEPPCPTEMSAAQAGAHPPHTQEVKKQTGVKTKEGIPSVVSSGTATPAEGITGNKTPVTITVGLDFGTSTIKAIATFKFPSLHKSPEQMVIPIGGQFCFPSVAYEQDTNLIVGEPLESCARVYRSVKVCLRCSALKEKGCRNCFKNARLSAEIVSWAILYFAVLAVRSHILQRFPAETYTIDWTKDVERNMGIPLDGSEQMPLHKLFRDILWRAVQHGSDVQKCTRISELVGQYKSLQDDHCPPDEYSNCFIFPEALVAVNAFLHSQQSIENGLYFICDVGAGTTDVAFFRFAQEIEKPIVFYGASCERAGGDDFAHALAQVGSGGSVDPLSEERIRMVNEQLRNGLDWRKLGPPYRPNCPSVFKGVYDQILSGRARAFHRAIKKENVFRYWKDLQGAIIGGGSQITGVTDTCMDPLRTGAGDPQQEYIYPDRMSFRPLSGLKNATPLHWIAYGLSWPRAEFYEAWQPNEVDDWKFSPGEPYNPFPGGNPYEK